MNHEPHRGVTIVLIHGLGANRFMMSYLEHCFARLGFSTLNWGYLSTRETIEHHAARLGETLACLQADPMVDDILLVTHSMGGIVARTALNSARYEKLRRFVMLAPPNRGSPWATRMGPWLNPVCRTLGQLADHPESYVNRLEVPEHVEIGVIAAESDFLVPRENTFLTKPHPHYVLGAKVHSGVLFRTETVNRIVSFWQTGEFEPTKSATADLSS